MTKIDKLEANLARTPRRWLVTGAAGFIGSHLTQRLLELGQSVVGLDNLSTGRRENLEDVRAHTSPPQWANFEFIEGDIRDPLVCERASANVRHVVHQAAIGSVPRSIEDPRTTHESNVNGFLNVLEAARMAEVESVVYASSSSVYGDHPELPKRENVVGVPLSPYAATKRINELYALAWQRCYPMRLAGLRYFNVVGPRQDPQGAYAAVVPRWLAALARGEQPQIFGDGETSRDFCPIQNVTQANLLAATTEELSDLPIFNVALGRQTTLNDLFRILRAEMTRLGAPCADVDVRYVDFRPGDIRHSLADTSKVTSILGYAPEADLASGLSTTCERFWEHVR